MGNGSALTSVGGVATGPALPFGEFLYVVVDTELQQLPTMALPPVTSLRPFQSPATTNDRLAHG